jgi:transposase-like protein
MNALKVFQSIQTQEQAIELLEGARWSGKAICPYCQSQKVSRHASGDRAQIRWQCSDCHRAFAVTVGTIFHGTHIPLRNWFLVLVLMIKSTKATGSAYRIARDLDMRRPTVLRMMRRIRNAMEQDTFQRKLLLGIVGANETNSKEKAPGREAKA